MSRYKLTEQANSDLDSIADYIGIVNDNPTAADRLLDDIHSMLGRLGRSPNIGQRRDDLRPNLRLFPVESYVILFYPADDGIEVAGIIHGARNIEGLFESGER